MTLKYDIPCIRDSYFSVLLLALFPINCSFPRSCAMAYNTTLRIDLRLNDDVYNYIEIY